MESIEIYPYQTGLNILQLLFNRLNIAKQVRDSLQAILKIDNIQVDINKTIQDLEINLYSQIDVILSKKITIQCVHEFLGTINFATDVYESANKFRVHISNLIKIKQCEIQITNSEDGTQFGSECWGKQGVFQNLTVFIQIKKQQQIQYKQQIMEITIDVFQPIAKYINQFKIQQNIDDELITFKLGQLNINPDLLYINLNIPLDQPWDVEFRQEFIYNVAFQNQDNKLITIPGSMEVFDLIRKVRQQFKIENTIPLTLEYKLKKNLLDISNTLNQECIPIYSQLTLIKEPSDNKINILLQNQYSMKQYERVAVNSTLADLDILINHDKYTETIQYFLEEQIKDKKFNLKQLDLQSECIINYQIIKQDQQQDLYYNQDQLQDIRQDLHLPSEDMTQITITFQNKYTKSSKQIKISSTCTIMDGFQGIVQTETLKDTKYYKVYFGNQLLDLKWRFDKLNIISNSILNYFTDFVIFQAQVQGQALKVIVDQNLPISSIEQQFKASNNLNQQLQLQNIQPQVKNLSLIEFLKGNNNFKFEFDVQNDMQSQEDIIELCVYVNHVSCCAHINMKQNQTAKALCQIIKYRYQSPRNQVLDLFIGQKKVDENETIYQINNIINQTRSDLRVQFITTLTLQLVNQNGLKQIIQAELENTFEFALKKNQIIGTNFTFYNYTIQMHKNIKDLPIENNSIIRYHSQLLMNFQNARSGTVQKMIAELDESLKSIINKLGVKINRLLYKNQVLDLTSTINSINYNPNENIIFEEQLSYHEASEVKTFQDLQN
ncbi:unnamed protein product (macronuclear) [Paramecium tetraurelia]|uniref:Chorein N-terminal domain-containing protein n=1 Tax=Paramecium tetraurelia TaxID=5888 RepID=A0CD20_PARTE|nr:uncharacterized protein GSPATT00037472001 [Paramecium tetraurelia]CAK68687.1 unnamed protein product [Paramecium tetraurelia]|eukprot:XP_001436084.1 hypothetical protein (macronuclear) [Paramecium tetraurelia strain d4-2]